MCMDPYAMPVNVSQLRPRDSNSLYSEIINKYKLIINLLKISYL